MDEELDYLWETLGLEITADLWPERDKIHPTLRPAITCLRYDAERPLFLLMDEMPLVFVGVHTRLRSA